VPVWYELAHEWIEAGELVMLGITQEQHPERCLLFAQWQGFAFPILWDPFNLTGSKAVPNFIAIDEHGIVRSTRPNAQSFVTDFLEREFDAPGREEVDLATGACSFQDLHNRPDAVSALAQKQRLADAVEELEERAYQEPENAVAAFRAGVARRMRYDSELAQPDDFQAAVDHWARALAIDPNQYIWRRRIQQYGPRMDKPYPFYTWVDTARAEIAARGETPVELVAELTPAELAEPAQPKRRPTEAAAVELTEPDPAGKIVRDEAGLIGVETAVAFDSSGAGETASVHVALRPDATRDAHWNHEAGPTVELWVDAPSPQRLDVAPRADVPTSEELKTLSFEVTLPEGEDELVLPGYALYYVCEGAEGTCLYLRQDFEVVVARP